MPRAKVEPCLGEGTASTEACPLTPLLCGCAAYGGSSGARGVLVFRIPARTAGAGVVDAGVFGEAEACVGVLGPLLLCVCVPARAAAGVRASSANDTELGVRGVRVFPAFAAGICCAIDGGGVVVWPLG